MSNLPEGFDWEFYLNNYDDLRNAGLKTEDDAIKHFLNFGQFENRVYKRKYSILKNHNIEKFEVSVIISIFNYSDYIKIAIESVISDETKPLTEIVIVDDCSTDNSLDIVKSYLDFDSHITIIAKSENSGLVETRNLGILNSSGDYVFILDADNQINKNCLIDHFNFLKANTKFIACYAKIECFDESDVLVREMSNIEFSYEMLKYGNYIDAMSMFDKKKLIDIGLYDTNLKNFGVGWEDYELWLRIASIGGKVGFIDKTLSKYLVKNGSMLSITNQQDNKNNLIVYLNNKYNANIQ